MILAPVFSSPTLLGPVGYFEYSNFEKFNFNFEKKVGN